MKAEYRKTTQFLMPPVKPARAPGRYNIYPAFPIGDNKIFNGLETLAEIISGQKLVLIDGYGGVFFDSIKDEINNFLEKKYRVRAMWINTFDFQRPENDTDRLIAPFLGGDDPLFGKRAALSLADFFIPEKPVIEEPVNTYDTVIYYGIGASLFSEKGLLVYLDLPKNEIQFRSRAGWVKNLGAHKTDDPKKMYKRFYFIDWVVLNRHKSELVGRIDILADTQRDGDLMWMHGDDFRDALGAMSRSPFRARPWFEPGTWGGSWIKANIPGVNPDVPNYAWSFELISPENGLILESSSKMLEFSFDFIMYSDAENVLGNCFQRFGNEFPIRFDFLDTFDGGNLSIQCHPRPDYAKENFGENFTQEETYYILDKKDDAGVYLGFVENIDRENFRNVLHKSFKENTPVDIEEFVQVHPSKKHDLFLIPYGTIHGSGRNNLVLEISSTPYIFTFKMYDWLRPDLDGRPRPLNIERAMDNLYFDRKGEMIGEKFISKPVLISEGEGWQRYHLPTHPSHLYDIHRYHFRGSVEITTDNQLHVLSLVEGSEIGVMSLNGYEQSISFAETFIIPAAAVSYTLINNSDKEALVIIAFVKHLVSR
jgi:mannose-6-phosphate isomerase class I